MHLQTHPHASPRTSQPTRSFIHITRGASPPLVLAFGGNVTFIILRKLYLPSILHLTLIRYNSLTINTLLSVRYYHCHLHATYTTCTLPHGTSTGGRYYGIGEQKSLLLRQISLCPCGVLSTAHVHVDCEAAR